MAASGSDWERGARRGTLGRLLVAAAVVALVVGIAVRSGPGTPGGLEVGPGTPAPPAGSAWSPPSGGGEESPLADGTWLGVVPPPVAWVRPPSMVYTGREVLAWGPVLEGTAGAAFEPSTRGWRPLPEAPLDAREGQVALWVPAPRAEAGTGEMLVLGGRPLRGDRRGDGAGAAFDPRSATWRRLADAPMRVPAGATAAWTGREVLVASGAAPAAGEEQPPAAAYDPSTDTWRPLPPLPPGAWLRGVAWTGGRALALLGQPGRQVAMPVATWEPDRDAWVPQPAAPLGVASSAVLLGTVTGAVLWARSSDGLSRLWFLDAADDHWEATPPAPLSDRTRPLLAWTGRHVVVVGGSDVRGPLPDGAVYDTVEQQWSVLPPAPRPVARPLGIVWTGREAVLVGYAERGRSEMRAAGWAPATLRP